MPFLRKATEVTGGKQAVGLPLARTCNNSSRMSGSSIFGPSPNEEEPVENVARSVRFYARLSKNFYDRKPIMSSLVNGDHPVRDTRCRRIPADLHLRPFFALFPQSISWHSV
jgi:hypothetical protein